MKKKLNNHKEKTNFENLKKHQEKLQEQKNQEALKKLEANSKIAEVSVKQKNLNKEIKKTNPFLGMQNWKKLLISLGIVLVPIGSFITYQQIQKYNYYHSNIYTGKNTSTQQQLSFVKAITKYVQANWRPPELIKAIKPKYPNYSHENQAKLAYLIYRSQQNSALYYNSFLYFMQAEFEYYNVEKQSNPLDPKNINSKSIGAAFSDIRNNKEFIEYTGSDNYEVLPDFRFVLNNYKVTGSFKAFLTLASEENNNPIFQNKKENLKLAYERLNKWINFAQDHPKSDFTADSLSMAKFYYLSLFQLNTDFNLQISKSGMKINPETVSELKSLLDNKDNNSPVNKDLKNFVKTMEHDKMITPAVRASYQTMASSYFGDSVFNNMADAVAGAPKQTQKKPNTNFTNK